MTELPLDVLAGLVAGQFVLAFFGVLFAYKLLEVSWGAGFVGSIIYGLGVLYSQWYIGHHVWEPGLVASEVIEVVVASLTGAILGIMITLALFEPDIKSDSESADNRIRPRTRGESNTEGVDIPGGLGED